MQSQILNFHLCPHCAALKPMQSSRCFHCGLGVSPIDSLRDRFHRLKKGVAQYREKRLRRSNILCSACPNCCAAVPYRSRHCQQCGWERGYSTAVRPTLYRLMIRRMLASSVLPERTAHCDFCEGAVQTRTRFCPTCLNPVQTAQPAFSWKPLQDELRRRRMRRILRTAIQCPDCDLPLRKQEQACLSCGWLRPQRITPASVLRTWLQTPGRILQDKTRFVPTAENCCPCCDVCIPPQDSMCMICGWKPSRPESLRTTLRQRRLEHQRMARLKIEQTVRVCEQCDLSLAKAANFCPACGWKPEPNAGARLLTTLQALPARIKQLAPKTPCPDCRTALPSGVRHCDACGWEKTPSRSWERHPRLFWLAPVCLILYTSILVVFMQMADPLNNYGISDRFGRTPGDSHAHLEASNPRAKKAAQQ